MLFFAYKIWPKMKCELPSKSISIFPSSHGYITGLANKISAGAYPVAVLGSERIACPAVYRSVSSQFFGRSWFPPQNNFNMRIWALNGIKKSHDSIMKARIFSFIFLTIDSAWPFPCGFPAAMTLTWTRYFSCKIPQILLQNSPPRSWMITPGARYLQ